MKLDGRRESTNVDDRRRGGTTKKASIGIGGIVIAAIIAYVSSGGDWGQVATAVVSQAQQSQTTEVTSNGYEPTAEEEELASFTKKILAGTEDVWTEEFEKMGKTYEAPGLVLFHGDVTSACGQANSSTGPFYCSGDQKVYIDLEFFTTMKQQFGADGDFCYAEANHDDSCPSHIGYHSYDCGTIHDADGNGHGCDGFRVYECGGHRYLACGKDGSITGYSLSCSMSEGQVMGYGVNCGKTEETLEAYQLTCTKTSGDIDYYEKTCGREEGEEIYIPDPPEENTGNNGNSTGQESSGDGNNGNHGNSGDDKGSPEPLPTPVVKPSPSAAPVIAEVTEKAPVRKKESVTDIKSSPTPELILTPPSPSPAQQVLPRIVEEETVELPEAAAQPEGAGGEPLVLKRRWAVFTPVIKMVSITSGTVLILAAIALLLLYLRRSVRVYNDDGKGRMKYLGRAAVTLSEEGYYIPITDKLEERATTNRYSIRPDLFLIGKNSSWEIYVVKNGKRKSVYLDKEMTFTI